MSPAVLQQSFEVPSLNSLRIGKAKTVPITGSSELALPKGKPWSIPAGIYSTRQIVEANAPLLETVLYHLGESPAGEPSAREQLLDNLASNLALETREASISIPPKDASRAELAQQAISIGKKLVAYARNVTNAPYDPRYVVRSPCEGHLLKPHVSNLMFGPRSLRHLMQIYNEYLHQMVLLRDALLPFENFEEVLIPITPAPKRGVRYIEEARASFLAEALTKQVTQRTLLKTAQAFLAPSLATESEVGFQYQAGTILPAFIAGGKSTRLLRYVPAVMDESSDQVSFQYELQDYYASKRSVLSPAADKPAPKTLAIQDSSLFAEDDVASKYLRLTLDWADASTTVDLGQAARGARYASYVSAKKGAPLNAQPRVSVTVHDAYSVLTHAGEGLILPPTGIHLIKSPSKLQTLALLGKLYPDNIVVTEGDASIDAALKAGTDGLPDAGRFVISTSN